MRSLRLLARTVPLTVSVFLLSVAPALAAEEGGSGGSEGTDWTGMILAGIVGVILGIVVFATVGGQATPDHHGAQAVHGDDRMDADPDQAASQTVSSEAPQ